MLILNKKQLNEIKFKKIKHYMKYENNLILLIGQEDIKT